MELTGRVKVHEIHLFHMYFPNRHAPSFFAFPPFFLPFMYIHIAPPLPHSHPIPSPSPFRSQPRFRSRNSAKREIFASGISPLPSRPISRRYTSLLGSFLDLSWTISTEFFSERVVNKFRTGRSLDWELWLQQTLFRSSSLFSTPFHLPRRPCP